MKRPDNAGDAGRLPRDLLVGAGGAGSAEGLACDGLVRANRAVEADRGDKLVLELPIGTSRASRSRKVRGVVSVAAGVTSRLGELVLVGAGDAEKARSLDGVGLIRACPASHAGGLPCEVLVGSGQAGRARDEASAGVVAADGACNADGLASEALIGSGRALDTCCKS